jgi:hypothetical protein
MAAATISAMKDSVRAMECIGVSSERLDVRGEIADFACRLHECTAWTKARHRTEPHVRRQINNLAAGI